MFKDLKKNDPKTHIIISLVLLIVLLVGIGVMLYLAVITKYEFVHIIYGIAGGVFIFFGIMWIVNMVKAVSSLTTKRDWDNQAEEVQAKLKFKVETKKYDIILEKLKKNEELDASEMKIVTNLEEDILGKKPGE